MSFEAGKQAVAAFAQRRSAGALGSRLPPQSGVTYDSIIAVAEEAVKESPTSFNCQETRVITLLGSAHQRYWQRVLTSPGTTESEGRRIQSALLPAMGSLLFFVDGASVQGLCRQFPAYAAELPFYAVQGAAMAIMAAWTAISSLDASLGAMTCYYGCGPIAVDAGVKEGELHPGYPSDMGVPGSWRPIAELVFGSVEKAACEVAAVEDSHRFMLFSDTYTSVPIPTTSVRPA